MKNLLFALFCCVACTATAQTGQPVQAPIIIKRVGSTDTIATTFQQAYDIARNGDAIYLPGGIFTAPSTFNKRLFVYGTGYNADSSNAMTTTRIQGYYNNFCGIPFFSLASGSSGSFLIGIDFDAVNIEGTTTVDFQRCKISALSFSSVQFTLNLTESVVINTGAPCQTPPNTMWTLNISNCLIAGALNNAGFAGANLIVKNSILLGATNNIITNFRFVEIDKSIIFLKAGVTSTLFSNVTTQTISNNLIISDLASRVNLNANTDYGNIIKNETFRDGVFINRVGNPYSPIANYRTQSTCTECANKGVYSDGNGGVGNFRATPPVHISQREISVGSTNNQLRFKFTVKPSN